MIEKNITNIDRGITEQNVNFAWENALLYASSSMIDKSVYAYKKFNSENIRYDNSYQILQNTWAQISTASNAQLQNIVTSSVNYFDKNVIIPIYLNTAHTQSAYLELFQIGYANKNGSGSLYGSQSVNIYGDLGYIKKEQTRTLYNNIKRLFTNTNSLTLDNAEVNDFVFFSVANQFLGDGIAPETLQLHMSKLDTSGFPAIDIEGPAEPLIFIDRKIQGTNIGYILSGSSTTGPFRNATGIEVKYGLINYSSGIFILASNRLLSNLGFSRGTTGVAPNEDWKMPEQAFVSMYAAIFGTIPGSGITNTPVGSTFALKSVQNINYSLYECELEKTEFNYSNNITYRDTKTNTFKVKKFVSGSSYEDNLFTGSLGTLYSSSNASTYQNPESFITTIGLYSDTYDLIAVAKLSKPIRKNYDKKIIINVRLDF